MQQLLQKRRIRFHQNVKRSRNETFVFLEQLPALDPDIVTRYEGALPIKPYNLLPLATKQDAMTLKAIPIAKSRLQIG